MKQTLTLLAVLLLTSLTGYSQTEGKKEKSTTTQAQSQTVDSASEDEAAIMPYYRNFFTNYKLGPEDIISVSVFGHERYSKLNITVPPNGRISYPLIAEGILVAGKTTEEVQADITKKLDEYIIDPKVTVSLDQAKSSRYSVLGDVVQPGIKPMMRRLTVYEAIAEAGGILKTGDKKKVFVLRRQASNAPLQQIPVNIAYIEKGKGLDNVYLQPGDQVIVPGNRLKKIQTLMSSVPLLSFASIFMGGGF
jgi:polysaccharide biosynthesis/export protein